MKITVELKNKRKMEKQKWRSYNEDGDGDASENYGRLSNKNGLTRTRQCH